MDIYNNVNNHNYLSRHPEIEHFYMPKTYYFRYLPERMEIHWAIIVPLNDTYHSPATIYFINNFGRVFDKLEFKSVKIARRRLRKCGFDYSTNRYCEETPREPIYIQLSEGRKSAPYSKGNLFQSVQRDGKNPDKYKKSYDKAWRSWHKMCENKGKKKKKWKRHITKYTQNTQNKMLVRKTVSYDIEALIRFLIWAFVITFILTSLAGW